MINREITLRISGRPGTGGHLLLALVRNYLIDMSIQHREGDRDTLHIGPLSDAERKLMMRHIS